MTNEDKKELLIALCGYYPYGVIVKVDGHFIGKLTEIENHSVSTDFGINYPLRLVKPYLRPMGSITEEEKAAITRLRDQVNRFLIGEYEVVDYYNAHFLDYRHLIADCLALEAPEGMYDIAREKEPVKPKFKVGDRIRLKGNTGDHVGFCIVDIREGIYWCDAGISIPCSRQHLFEKF